MNQLIKYIHFDQDKCKISQDIKQVTIIMSTNFVMVLSLCILECVCQETTRIVYENAGVESGQNVYSICLLSQVNSSHTFSGFNPEYNDSAKI